MQSAEMLSIIVPPEMASFIRQKVDSGLYGSNSEIIREAMRALMERERSLERLDGAIALGLADAERGRMQEIEALRRELRGTVADGSPAA
jgi:antitoxin ParD1/3/4